MLDFPLTSTIRREGELIDSGGTDRTKECQNSFHEQRDRLAIALLCCVYDKEVLKWKIHDPQGRVAAFESCQ